MISTRALFLSVLFFESCFCCTYSNKENACCLADDFEYHCPTKNGDIIIHTKEKVLIYCPSHSDKFPLWKLRKIKINKTKSFTMKNCSWPDNSFHNIFRQLSLDEIRHLEFSDSSIDKITRASDFKRLDKLEELNLGNNGIADLNGDIFLNTPNLLSLELDENNVSLKKDAFKHLPLLQFLDLSLNNLTDLPPDVFRPLMNLRSLHIWSNKLTKLDDFVFKDLASLHTLEMSMNKIETISENAFKGLKNLKQINLSSNKIKTVPSGLFAHNRNLKNVKMRYNFYLKLPDYLFANKSLTQVDLFNCLLGTIPEHVFANSTSLRIIKLEKNNLQHLPEVLFQGLDNLEEIRLQDNKIESISKVFTGLQRLKSLYLQDNLISMLASEVFADLTSLEKINLKNNRITSVDAQLFFNNRNLGIINLSSNGIVTELDKIIDLSRVPNLTRLDLSENNITTVKLENFKPKSRLFVKLDYNPVTVVDFQNFDFVTETTILQISLKNNSIECDCQNYHLFDFLINKNKGQYGIDINIENSCAGLWIQKNISADTSLSSLTCLLEKVSNYTECPRNCSCNWRPHDKAIIVDCSFKNLTRLPEIDLGQVSIKYNQTVVKFQGNDLTIVPEMTGYDNVTQLFLSDNKVCKVVWLPPKLKVLELDHNHLTNLDGTMVKQLNSTNLKKLSLHDNPWLCDCSSLSLAHFLRQHNNLINPYLRCVNNNKLLINLKEIDLCRTWDLAYIILAVLSVLLTLAVFLALYYRYQQSIKVWLFAKNLCLCWITEEELDKDKTYDAFISYSHKDEDFVVKNLVPELESGSRPYKLCLHQRDWIPGELITNQIYNSVHQSRRTLVVLSPNFLESVWGKMEFLTAHTSAMNDGRTKVIIVLSGDVDVDRLDEELKVYLKTNTYIKWGDPYFWSKLKYALPHRRVARRYKATNTSNFGDGRKLLNSVPPTPDTTPPISSNSSLTNVSPFCFAKNQYR